MRDIIFILDYTSKIEVNGYSQIIYFLNNSSVFQKNSPATYIIFFKKNQSFLNPV